MITPKPQVIIYISAKDSCSGTVTNSYTGYSVTFSIAADSVIAIDVPPEHIWRDDQPLNREAIKHFAVHVEASDTISAYAITREPPLTAYVRNEASFFIPTEALGSSYIVISTEISGSFSASAASIICTENNTEIEIIPVGNSSKNLVAGNTYTITMNKGETYSFDGLINLTGSIIRAKDSCKKIAVLAGSLNTPISNSCSNRGYVFEVLPPIDTWGQNFYCAPIRNKFFNTYRILAAYDNTVVTAGATTRILAKTQYMDITANSFIPLTITASKPVGVIGFVTGGPCTGFPSSMGSPGMYWVPAIEKKVFEVNIQAVRNPSPDSQFVNIMVDTADIGYVKVNGNTISSQFKIHSANPAYAYAQYRITSDITHLVCEKGFIATIYGYGALGNAYIYSAGCDMRKFRDIQYTVNGITRHIDDTLALCTGKSYTFGTFRTDIQIWEPFGDDTTQRDKLTYSYSSPGYYSIYNYPPPFTNYCISAAQSTMTIKIRVDSVCVTTNPKTDTVICQGQSLALATREANDILTGCRRNT